MKTSSKRIMFIILAMVFLVASVVVYSSLISNAYGSVVELRGKLASQSDTLTRYQTTFSKLQKLVVNLNSAPQQQQQVSLVLPPTRDVSYMVGQIVGLAEANGLTVSLLSTQVIPVQPSQSQVVRNIGRMKADLELSGSYAGFKAFLRQVESNILILDAADVKVATVSKTGGGSSLNFNVSITSYYQTPQ